MKKRAMAGLVLVASLLAACASSGRISDDERLAIYRANAGEPVRSFRFFGRLDSWTPLGSEALAVWTRPSTAYLLELAGSCPDLPFATAITVTSQAGSVHARFDKVRVLGQGSITIPCIIREIRPLDTKGIKADEAERREAGTVPDEAVDETTDG
ncbi:DUF6491 family protein [Marilutibacter alkalisoli]|uniref:Lipoprotein n=1 Tax=Marilutibacter alkalisoli TaxID=2591633 RepID=A0A514BQ23_9GAMM|nr:DUF6491 family protein [Lysobacter alkalisoli]QDH69457.1 hypothetical protein FKV23_04635 [Lysobacter alkalisoli]